MYLAVALTCCLAKAQTVTMRLWATGENHVRQVKTVPLLDNYVVRENGDDVFNRYGSDSRIKTDATGFYYTKKIDGRWWIIDPDGHAGIDMSVTSLPDLDETKATRAFEILRKNGFNGTGNFLSKENMTKVFFSDKYAEKLSYTRRRNFFQSYRIERQKNYLTPTAVKNNPQNYVTVFDPEWESFVDNFAKSFASYRNERELLGYFSDNEINFKEYQLQYFLRDLPVTDPNYLEAIRFINEKGLTKEYVLANYDNLTDIKNGFLELIMERYFSVVTAAIKKYDPNHLYLGTRLHGKARDSETAVTISSKYCDIVSVNYYNYVFPGDQISNPAKWGKWLQKYDKPAMITEFYTKEYNAAYPDQPGAGFYTDSQEGRGIFYQSTCLDVLKSKYYVGWHYFRWQDDPVPNFSNKGMVNAAEQEYTGMTSYMEELNRQVYHIIDYLDGKNNNPDISEVRIPVREDTFIQLSGNGQDVANGNESTLSLATTPSASGIREIMLKFDLSNYIDSLNRLVDARIELHYLTGDTEQKISVTGLKDNSWDEGSLTGIIASGSNSIRNSFGKGRVKTFTNLKENSVISLNVRNWLAYEADNNLVSFRLTTEKSSLIPSLWASKENSNSQLQPVLILSLSKNNITNTEKINLNNQIKIFVTDGKIHFTGISACTLCEIYNLSGQLIKSTTFIPGSDYNLNIDRGVYFVRTTTNTNAITQKIILK